ncbi:hypothetical protein ACTFBT_16160 [Streptomyces microflavus]|uniref:hypothetical protein n=1 Tax=Streptomyces TaxID=1883 RepID=UPI000516D6F8|nr:MULTISPECIES: hypothetical protein [Streptomyces]MDX2981220.1 hypothetical protein [Streptomyces sp. NRRL_B-2249]
MNATLTTPVTLTLTTALPGDPGMGPCPLGTLQLDITHGHIDMDQVRQELGTLLCEAGNYLLAGGTPDGLPVPTG